MTLTSKSIRMGQLFSLKTKNLLSCFRWSLKHMNCSHLPRSFGLMMMRPFHCTGKRYGCMQIRFSGSQIPGRPIPQNCVTKSNRASIKWDLPRRPKRCSHLRLRNRRDGRKNPRRSQARRQVRAPPHRTRKYRSHRLTNWLNMRDDTWNCKQ